MRIWEIISNVEFCKNHIPILVRCLQQIFDLEIWPSASEIRVTIHVVHQESMEFYSP